MDLNYKSINKYLLYTIPELADTARPVLLEWENNPPPYVFWETVLNPFVRDLLYLNLNKQLILKVFNMYEDMAKSNDEDVNDLLIVSLLEYLWDDLQLYNISQQYMHKNTKELFDSLALYMRKPTTDTAMCD